MKARNIYKILMTDTVNHRLVDWMMVDGMPKLFTDSSDAAIFCEGLNRIAREDKATWRYEPALLTTEEQAMIKMQLMREQLTGEMF